MGGSGTSKRNVVTDVTDAARPVNVGATIQTIFGKGTYSENTLNTQVAAVPMPEHRPSLARKYSLNMSVRTIEVHAMAEEEGGQKGEDGVIMDEPVLNDDEDEQRAGEGLFHSHWRRRNMYWKNFKVWLFSSWTHWIIILWLMCVVVDGAALFLAMITALRMELGPNETTYFVEVTSQIMNFLFQGAAMVTHPPRLRHLYLWFKGEKDLVRAERNHPKCMPEKLTLKVLLLLNLNNFSQYALAGLMWGYWTHPGRRPALAVAGTLIVSFGAGVAGGVYEAKYIGWYGEVEREKEQEDAAAEGGGSDNTSDEEDGQTGGGRVELRPNERQPNESGHGGGGEDEEVAFVLNGGRSKNSPNGITTKSSKSKKVNEITKPTSSPTRA